MRIGRYLIAISVSVLVLATACSGSTTQTTRAAEDGDSQTELTPGTQPANRAGELPLSGPVVERAVGRAEGLVERLGDSDRAVDALLISAELGYSGPQILASVDSGSLETDGTIREVPPDGPRLGRIDIDIKAGQVYEHGKRTKRPTSRQRVFARLQTGNDDKILLERLRDAANRHAEFDVDRQELVGLEGIMLILVLLEAGATPEQVIDTLVLGVYFYESGGVCYSQTLPRKDNPPEVRACDGAPSAPTQPQTQPAEPAAPAEPETLATAARYESNLDGVLVDDPDSSIMVVISADGTVSGRLTATEQLDNYIASIDLCGIVGDKCEDDGVESCPATVVWSSDLSTLQFGGTAPDQGRVTGTISIVFDTTPRGCGAPSTETTTFDIEATVSPDRAQITVPVVIDLVRVPPDS